MSDIVLGEGLNEQVRAWVETHAAHAPVLMVVDENTYKAAGSALEDVLEPHTIVCFFRHRMEASIEKATQIMASAENVSAILAVGSGTINDVSKYAAHQLKLPYAVYATAPSMNGYVSSTASLKGDAHKGSYVASQPEAVFADLKVLAHAPTRMIRAGLGDSICRSTVQVDWLLAHYLLDEPYDAAMFEPMIELETELLKHLDGLSKKDPKVIELLMRWLILSGQAMHEHASSMPASQGEHMIAHWMENVYQIPTHFLHGEQIGVTTATMATLQEKLLLKRPVIKPNITPYDRFKRLFGNKMAQHYYDAYQQKLIDEDKAEAINAKLESHWEEMAQQMRGIMLGASSIELCLKKTMCPVSYKDLNWHKDRYEHAVSHAYLSRERLTFLDLAAMDKTLRFWY